MEGAGILGVNTRHMTDLTSDGLVLDSAVVSLYDMSGRFIESLGRFPHNQRLVRREAELQTTLGVPFSSSGSVTSWSGGFCYSFGVEPEIKCYGEDGHLRSIIRVTTEPRPVTQAHIELFWRRVRESENEARVRAFSRMRDHMVFPDFFPAFSDLRVDEEDRLWAQVYSEPEASQVEWWVFRDGRWLSRLTVDSSFELMAFLNDGVLGVWRDRERVEHVRRYRLVRDESHAS
jgi:hypothetical protein